VSPRRRPINNQGYLICSRCKKARHISQFYTASKGVVWWVDPLNGTEWPRPQSWCSPCVKESKLKDQDDIPVETPQDAPKSGPPRPQRVGRRETVVTGNWEPED
jgi:hypothetical protein